MIRFIVLFLIPFTLIACATMTPEAHKRAICNQLKSDEIFSGSTYDTRKANMQTAEEPMVQHTYDRDDCDKLN